MHLLGFSFDDNGVESVAGYNGALDGEVAERGAWLKLNVVETASTL